MFALDGSKNSGARIVNWSTRRLGELKSRWEIRRTLIPRRNSLVGKFTRFYYLRVN